MKPTRHCRRKHRKAWTTKTLGDGTTIRVCPICGSEPDDEPDDQWPTP